MVSNKNRPRSHTKIPYPARNKKGRKVKEKLHQGNGVRTFTRAYIKKYGTSAHRKNVKSANNKSGISAVKPRSF